MKTVSVLGMWHEEHENNGYLNQYYSLKEIEKIIINYQPDVILAELWPNWKEKYFSYCELPDFKLEYKKCICPLVEKLGIDIIPIDYGSLLYAKEFRYYEQAKKDLVEFGDMKYELYYKVDNVIFNAIPEVFKSAKEINSEASNDLFQSLMDIDSLWFFKDNPEKDFWERHNQENFKYIESILNQSNYKRILITFGMQHKYWFERELKKKQEIQFQSIVNYCE